MHSMMKNSIGLQQNLHQLNAAVQVSLEPVMLIDELLINKTIRKARLAPDKRARILLHSNMDDTLHEMLIALPIESCDIPHINFKSGKSFHVMHGEMIVMVFSEDGKYVTPYSLQAGKLSANRFLRLNKSFWHTIIPLSNEVVFIETITGPFTGNRFAPWSPQKNQDKWIDFAQKLRAIGRKAPFQTYEME